MSLCACGDDDDSVPSVNHGISGSKELNTLTQEEIDRICKDNRERAARLTDSSSVMRDSLQLGCTIVGLASTVNRGTKAECESNRDQCIQRLNRITDDSNPPPRNRYAIELPCPPAMTRASGRPGISWGGWESACCGRPDFNTPDSFSDDLLPPGCRRRMALSAAERSSPESPPSSAAW